MIALGIDPGTRLLGWGLVERNGSKLIHRAHGVLKLPAAKPLCERLPLIEQGLVELLERFSPDVASVEAIFFHKDAQAAAKLGHARGVVLLVMGRAGLEVAEYPPARVKQVVAGSGQADKRQVALMIRAMLALDEVPPSDAADALALAVTRLRLGVLSEAAVAAIRKKPRRRAPLVR